MLDETTSREYRLLTESSAYVQLPRTRIEFRGDDRHVFLHNFCTVDIKGSKPGDCREGFILNGKGKLLGHLHFLIGAESIDAVTVAGQFDVLRDHLDKYIIREDVQISDVSDQWFSVFVCCDGSIGPLSIDADQNQRIQKTVVAADQEFDVEIAHIELAGWGLLISVRHTSRELLETWLAEQGLVTANPQALEIIRIENCTPRFLVDSGNDNLPQELDRDDRTISFTKGCYLGQETVARLDSLGRVNKIFRAFEIDMPAASAGPLMIDSAVQGTVTSVCWSPRRNGWFGLGFAKRKFDKPGQVFEFDGGKATIVQN